MTHNEAMKVIKEYDYDYYEYIQNNAMAVSNLMIENYAEYLKQRKNKLTQSEIHTLQFYMEKALIDAKGMCAIGVTNKETVSNIKSILKKVK